MPLIDQFRRLPLDSITVLRDERQRKIVDPAKDGLQADIKRNGVLEPILCESRMLDGKEAIVLLFGERRYIASRNLGLPDIPVCLVNELPPTERQIIELAENLHRIDLEWQDQVDAVQRIHALYRDLDPDWTQAETAAAIGLSGPTVSMYLSVARQMSDERIAKSGTVREAYNVIERREARNMGDALEVLLGPSPVLIQPAIAPISGPNGETITQPAIWRAPSVSETILNESFLEWAPAYSGPKFNLLHCDFPYGINPFSGEQGRGSESELYEDSRDVYFDLIHCLCTNWSRLMSMSSHIMFWYSDKLRDETITTFRHKAPQIIWHPYSLVWVKSDNAGIAADPRHGPRHIYETCLLGTTSQRQICQVVGDAYSCSTDKRLHPSCKPESMLFHFLTMLCDEQSLVLDPTCGSGSAIRAAERHRAKHVLGLEQNWEYCESARKALRDARLLRDAERATR